MEAAELAAAVVETVRGMTPGELVSAIFAGYVLAMFGVGILAGGNSAWNLNLRLVGWIISGLLWLPLSLIGRATGRAVPMVGASMVNVMSTGTTPQLRRPDEDEMIPRRTVDPRRNPRGLRHGLIWTPPGTIEAVSATVVGESGSAKGQAYANYKLQHQMRYSNENMILMEVKPNLEQSEIVYANLRPGDRIFEMTFQPKDEHSSALSLFAGNEEIADVAYELTHDPSARDSHWNEKAAELIEVVAISLGASSLHQVRDVIADREALARLRTRYPMVNNVADEDKEWGYIRSTAAKALKPLAYPNVRRVFAGGPDVEQPDFSRTDGRDIVIWRPDWSSAARTYRLITAGLHATIMSAVRGGYAGGPGTKVILDEAGSFMRLSRLGGYLDLARGGKLNLIYVLQSRTQLAAQLDRAEAERIWAATEAKIIGPTTDLELARDIAALSGQRRVHYSGPRQHDEILAQRRETTRNAINATELTGQQEGEFTLVHRGKIIKYRVPRKFYHYRQAKQPPAERPRPHGVADPFSYVVPQMMGQHVEPAPELNYEDDQEDDQGDII